MVEKKIPKWYSNIDVIEDITLCPRKSAEELFKRAKKLAEERGLMLFGKNFVPNVILNEVLQAFYFDTPPKEKN